MPFPRNPFIVRGEHQGARRHAVVKILVGGGGVMQDVTSRMNPYLISVQVIDARDQGCQCNIELDDRNAELQIPPDRVNLQVAMGWAGEGPRVIDIGRSTDATADTPKNNELEFGGPGLELVFSGSVKNVESGFGRRSGGRRMWIEGDSGTREGNEKSPTTATEGVGNPDDASGVYDGSMSGAESGGAGVGGVGGGAGEIPLQKIMDNIFGKHGIAVKLSPEMAKITRKFWSVTNQSPQDFGMAIAHELGASFSIQNGIATMVSLKDKGLNVDGDSMPVVEAIWGVNLIGWRIKPFVARPQFGSAAARFFDIFEGKWKDKMLEIGGIVPFGNATAVIQKLTSAVTGTEAEQSAEGSSSESSSERGKGWVLMNGEPNLKAGGHIVIMGARPGIDGIYMITEAEHNYTRGVGYTTRCNVQYPEPIDEASAEEAYPAWQSNKDAGKEDPKIAPPEEAAKPKKPSTNPYIRALPKYLGGEGPLRKREAPAPPGFTEAEKERMREWYRQNNQDLPPELS